MQLWERAIELEEMDRGFIKHASFYKGVIIQNMCPGMYSDLNMKDYKDDKYENCQDFAYDNDYVPCKKCWERKYAREN